MKTLRLLVLLLVLCGAAFAAAPWSDDTKLRIAGETTYEPHALVRLKAENVPAKAGILWRVYPSNIDRATTPKSILEFSAHPGTYQVDLLAIVVGEDQSVEVVEVSVRVTIKSCGPPPIIPPPDPHKPPPDPPKPPPSKGKLDPANAIGRIQFANAGCSATVIYPQRADGKWDVLTAAHCVKAVGETGTMTMPSNGAKHNVRVVVLNRDTDLCWLEITEPVDDIEYAKLSQANPPSGTPVWHQGYGVDRPRNREEGTVTGFDSLMGQLRFVLSVSSGDSGGGIFRSDTNEVVSAVCCTTSRGQKVDMWGGSTVHAWQLRPKR